MKNRIFAICDPEETYVMRFMEYLSEKQISPFYVRAFTSEKDLKEFTKSEEIEVLLISSELAGENIGGFQNCKIFLLTSGRISEDLEGIPAIYKYQSAEKIVREVLYYYAEDAKPFLQAVLLKKEIQLLGIYSPVHRTGKTAFALALGQAYASQMRTLYLNLEPCSGLNEQLNVCMSWNLGDLLYFLKKGKQGFLYKLRSVIQNLENLDYISPVLSADDLLSVTGEEWELLLERLLSDAGYECLILDFSDCIQGLPELLARCSCVYMPVLEDPISQMKIRQFDRILEMRGYENLRQTLKKIQLPRRVDLQWENASQGYEQEMRKFAETLKMDSERQCVQVDKK